MSIPSSSSGISTETYSFSQNENGRAGDQETRSEQKALVEFASDSSEELEVEKNDVGDLQPPSTSDGHDVGPSATDGQNFASSHSNGRGIDEGPSMSNQPDSRSQRSRDWHEMSTHSEAHFSDRNGGIVSHPGLSSTHSAQPSRWASSRAFPITLFLIAPRSIDDVAIQPQKARGYGRTRRADFSLGKGIDAKFFAWYCRGEVDEHLALAGELSAVYETWTDEYKLPGSFFADMSFVASIKNHVLENVLGNDRVLNGREISKVVLPSHQVHVNVCDEQGKVKDPGEYTLIEWLAVTGTLIAATSKLSFRDTFAEYFHKRPNQFITMCTSAKQSSSELLKTVVQWASHWEEETSEELTSSQVARQGLVSLALLEILVALRNVPTENAVKGEDLAKAFDRVLVPLNFFFRGLRPDSPFLEQEEVRFALQATMSHFVSCVSPFQFDWIEHLEMLSFFDPTLEFLNEWKPFWIGDLDFREFVKAVGMKYRDAIRKLCGNAGLFSSSVEKLSASGCALQAAPTIPDFFQAAPDLEEAGWLLCKDCVESVAVDHMRLMDDALDKCFSKITEHHEKQAGRKARLQRQLEMALDVELRSNYPFLATSFRDHLCEVFQEIIVSEDESQGVIRDSLSFVKSRSTSITDLFVSLVISPHAFISPLRACEVTLISSFCSTSNSKIYSSGQAALLLLANQESSYVDYREVLQAWIQGTARRKVSDGGQKGLGYLPPHSFVATLEELLLAGVKPSFAPLLSQMALSMAIEECPSLPAFLLDSKEITLSQARAVQDHYLEAAGRLMETVLEAPPTRSRLSDAACAALLAICQETNRGHLQFHNPIGEQLCVKLLDSIMKAYGTLKDELVIEPIETLMEFKFATLLMQIEKCSRGIKSHVLYRVIHKACVTLGHALQAKSVRLRYINSSAISGEWEKIFQIMDNAAFVAAVKKGHEELLVYKKRLKGFEVLVYNICPFLMDNHILVEEHAEWMAWFMMRSSQWQRFTLNEIHSSPDHWPHEVHKAVYDYLDPIVTLHGSRIFLNILLESIPGCAGRPSPFSDSESEVLPRITMSTIANEIFPQALRQYESEMRSFVATNIDFGRILMERVCVLLNGVDPNAVETEFEIARRQLGWSSTKTHEFLKRDSEKETNIVSYLQSWKGVNVLKELHAILPLVASVFDLNEDCDGLVQRIWNVVTECTPQCSFRRFREVLQRDGRNVLALFSTSEVEILKELTKTGQLIMFLRESVQEDLRHLLDAIEDPSATQMWEGLINDLIDLQRIFRPILSAKAVDFNDLREAITVELKTSSSNSFHLCEKLKACNKEAHGLRQYFLGVANRMYKDNDQIAGILRSGKYCFSLSNNGCLLVLNCSNTDSSLPGSSKSCGNSSPVASSQGARSYTLAQLQELRSRARWTISSNTYVKKSKTALAFGADWVGTDEETIETTEKCAAVFISHIDVAEQIVALLTELHSCGHFSYAKFERVASSFVELQTLTDFLNLELATWIAALMRARKEFLCLNFFRSVELRLILEVLLPKHAFQVESSFESAKKMEHILDLFVWAGVPTVDLNIAKRLMVSKLVPLLVTQIAESTHNEKGDLIHSCLGRISSVMESAIFQEKVVKSFASDSSTTEKSKSRVGITLADVDDPLRELEAVASLFSERDLILHGNASNVIVCGPSTAWEDLYLLILRYLHNVGQEGSFYCIVYVERLSFDCQAQLVTFIQNIVYDHQICGNELALVSCSQSKFLRTLSQRLQVQVHHMATGTGDAIGAKENGRYTNMWVITSDLPGMGKTRFVHQYAETIHYDCIRTLTISGEVSRNLLIQRLKKLFMLPPILGSFIFLHLDISVVSNPETLNDLLFELLVLGCLKSDCAGLFHLDTQYVAIEVANTYHNYLASKLPITRWFRREHLVWNIEDFEPDTSMTSDVQFVCNYLSRLRDGDVDTWNPGGKDPTGNVVAISKQQCQRLLQSYFVCHLQDRLIPMSFSLLQAFTKFFAQQLRAFSESPYFVPEHLTHMRALANTRRKVVISILGVSVDLSIRSVKPWLDEQQEPTVCANAEVMMAARMDNMLRWSDSKRVMIFFHLNGRMAVLYKDLSHVPTPLVDLFHKQNAKLPNYGLLTSAELYEELWPILHRTTRPSTRDSLYVLTADNFLKMALIFTKVKAGVPVVIMGETGCGKTSLLRQLADYCCISFESITLHAGISEGRIRNFLLEAEMQAANHVVWVFLDEINACDHLGFLVGVVCHHLLDGRPLHSNVKVLAACNPYRKHDSHKQRAGLSARKTVKSEHLDKAYTVHPLPEALVENVQDFGILNAKDEQLYIQAMVLKSTKKELLSFPLVELIVMSQAFMKEKCGEASVSLRDARRCIDLFLFFGKDLETRTQATALSRESLAKRAALLAFAHCYYYRLATDEERTNYKAKYVATFNGMKWRFGFRKGGFTEKRFEKELFEEQMNLLDHMEIPPGIAKNQALRENVFVTLTCILQKIPLFVVGKPGSGKTLSLQLIFSNLRGSGMKDPYFRQKPTMFMFSYQGSESSTSEGILKVFEKAYRCVEDNKRKNVNAVVVVVLDEVGLAEISSHNPLKVLHSLLEPDGEQQLAVVGISNWSLDAAKMNRAIHISQPDPTVSDLVSTGKAILDSYGMRKIYGDDQMTEMKWLAEIYHMYHVSQSKPDFHGLRDFYSLVKSLRGDEKVPKKWTPEDLLQAVWRNFGGSPEDTALLISTLNSYFRHRHFDPPPALDLVKANLDDVDARHLMLISTGESGIGILENMLPRKEKLIIVHGSKYKDDCSDDYAYLMLSNIILHMEHGRHILLKGVERVWSSLYDMLNQHYTIVGGRRNCRIAIGAFSNPMCYVHDNFRCIVVVDQSQVPSLDPPFLNRFEKQVLNWEALLTPQQKDDVQSLKKWVKAMACTSEDDTSDVEEDVSFSEKDLIAGYSGDTLASLVLKNWDSQANHEVFLARCKEELLLTAYPDGMMRAHYSRTCLRGAPDAKRWTNAFFQKRSDEESLSFKIRHYIGDKALWQDDLGCKLVLTTRSNVHTNIRVLLNDLPHINVQIIKLGDFTAERQLNVAIQLWSKSANDLLIIQSDTKLDKDHLPLAKVHVERTRADLLAQAQQGQTRRRHVVFILHSHRGEQGSSSPFSFLSGWKQITLDQLHQEDTDYREYLDKSMAELFQSERFREGHKLMLKVLTWSFLCIKYPRGRQAASHCQQMVLNILNDKGLYDCFIFRAVEWLEEDAKQETGKLWQTSVVCNRGRLALASNLHYAFSQYVEEKLREPIARLVYVLESKSALGSYFNMSQAQKELWRQVFMDRQTINIDNVPQPMHPEGYAILDPRLLRLPWSSLYAEHVDKHLQELYLSRFSNLDGDVLALGMAKDVSVSLQSNPLMKRIEENVTANPDDYCHDFAMLYAPYPSSARTEEQALVFEWLLRQNVPKLQVPLMLHALVWRKAETLKAQTILASSCYGEEEIATEVEAIKRSKAFTKDFDIKFALLCVQKMVPSEKRMIENAGGLEKWLHQFDVLIKLLSNIGGHTSILLMLRVMQDFACLVVNPLSMALEDLCSLSHWFQRQNFRPPLELLITKITSLLPDVNALRGLPREMYFRFIASTFCRLLDSSPVPQEAISTMSGVIFRLKAPTCLMKAVMAKLLKAALEASIPAPKLDSPSFVQLAFLKGRNLIKEQAWQSEYCEPFILLCDVIYDSVKGLITPELLSGVDMEAFGSENFLQCLNQVTRELTLPSGTLSLRAACSFAVMRRVMEVLAQDLVTVFRKEKGIFQPRLVPDISRSLFNFFTQSHHNVLSMKQYLMKVLRYHLGFSIQNLSHLANECRISKSLELYAVILDWNMLKEVDNPLGFNPFTTLFSSYERVDELLWNTVYAEGEKLQRQKGQVQDLGVAEQGAMASAVASKIFLVKASRNLIEKEEVLVNWLQQEGTLVNWEMKWRDAVLCLIGNDPLQLSCDSTSSDQLQFKALAVHILLVVSSFATTSPLRGYLALSETHLMDAFVLALPDNLLASIRGALRSMENLGEYKHECGYVYVIGNCTMANQRARCPACGGSIGGSNHSLDPKNYRLDQRVEPGYISDHVARSDTYYVVRKLERKAFRALRLLVHYCILLGLYMGRHSTKLAAALNTPNVIKEVETLIEEDLVVLGKLLGCNREVTCQFMHCVVASLPDNKKLSKQLLGSAESRAAWETGFDQMVKALGADVKRSVSKYIEAHRGQHELTELLEERRLPPFPGATAAFSRISVTPSFQNFQAMYLQDEQRRSSHPVVERFFVHMGRLSEMKHLLGLLRFSQAVHEQLASKITRPEAATISVGEYLGALPAEDRRICESFPAFAQAWNVMRLKVTAFECTEFKRGIPEMNEDASIGFCLVESRDLGIYLAAILDHLRTIQNAFLDDVAEVAGADGGSRLSVRVHMCKAEDVLDFDEQWPERIVCDAAMTNLQFSLGQNVIYDDVTIAEHLHHHLVDQKPHLDPWEPFLFKHEAFHKHMTILSDVASLVPQLPLGSELLTSLRSEIELSPIGSSRYLATLDLCLGFLRRTGGDPTEPLHSYCQRWLGHEPAFLQLAHQQVQLQHVVSLYEGLEDAASVGIEGLVHARYRTPLPSDVVEELRAAVEVKRPWQARQEQEDGDFKIAAEMFQAMLRRFMFRYLIGDQLNAEVALSIYITDDRLIQWPEEVVDDVDDVFPTGLLVEHSHATYVFLSEMLKVVNAK